MQGPTEMSMLVSRIQSQSRCLYSKHFLEEDLVRLGDVGPAGPRNGTNTNGAQRFDHELEFRHPLYK
jgi:hypothetical protein